MNAATPKPRRSILFLFVTARAGLLGSTATPSARSTAGEDGAVLNIDA